MFIESRSQKTNQPQRGAMLGHLQAMTQTERNRERNISPRALMPPEALNYKHCVPPGLKPAASCDCRFGRQKLKVPFAKLFSH